LPHPNYKETENFAIAGVVDVHNLQRGYAKASSAIVLTCRSLGKYDTVTKLL
jgi:hypothetical protein